MKNEKEKKKQNKNKQTIEETMKCPKCGSTHLTKDYSRAELVCEKCGLVIDVEIAGVMEATIRNRYKELPEKLDIDIVM